MCTTPAPLTEAEKMLKEARKIILASSLGRSLHKDWLQRTANYFRKRDAGSSSAP